MDNKRKKLEESLEYVTETVQQGAGKSLEWLHYTHIFPLLLPSDKDEESYFLVDSADATKQLTQVFFEIGIYFVDGCVKYYKEKANYNSKKK